MEKEVFSRSKKIYFKYFSWPVKVFTLQLLSQRREIFAYDCEMKNSIWNISAIMQEHLSQREFLSTETVLQRKKNYYNDRGTCNFNIQRSQFCVISKGQ